MWCNLLVTLDQIRQKTYFLTSTNVSSFPDSFLVPEANNALERVTSLIMKSDGRWQFDDENNTDLPIATTALASGQQDYALAITHLDITRVELLDNTTSPQWHKLIPIDQTDIYNTALTNFMSGTGIPIYYDKLGNSVFLYPTPSYSQAASLKLYFQRPPSYFLTSDTTKAPGFNSLYHDLIPLWVAYNYAISMGKENANTILAEINMREDALREDYTLRGKDDPLRLRARPRYWK